MFQPTRNLFLSIKYHPQIVGRMMSRKMVRKDKTRLVAMAIDGFDYSVYDDYKTDIDGFYIFPNYKWGVRNKELFFKITARKDYVSLAKGICSKGIKVMKEDEHYSRGVLFIELKHLDYIVEHFHQDIENIDIPIGFRIGSHLVDCYFDIIRYQIEYMEKNGFSSDINIPWRFGKYEGHHDGHFRPEECKNAIKKRWVFANESIYHSIRWTFGLVKRFKGRINWSLLMSESDLVFDIPRLIEYEDYLLKDCTDYTHWGFVDNDFIRERRNAIEWKSFAQTAYFNWNCDDLIEYYAWARKQAAERNEWLSLDWLARNPRFQWTQETFRCALELDNNLLSFCIKEPKFKQLLLAIPDRKSLVESICHVEDFWLQLEDGGEVPNRAYSRFFTKENIERYQKDWEVIVCEKSCGINRRPDTNTHYYRAYNMWDRFADNKGVKLTYELAKLLYVMTIREGGGYEKEDDCYLSEDYRLTERNALDMFAWHDFANETELEQVLQDDALFDFFMTSTTYANTHMLDYIIDNTLKTIRVEDYLDIVNKMTDWDSIQQNYHI